MRCGIEACNWMSVRLWILAIGGRGDCKCDFGWIGCGDGKWDNLRHYRISVFGLRWVGIGKGLMKGVLLVYCSTALGGGNKIRDTMILIDHHCCCCCC